SVWGIWGGVGPREAAGRGVRDLGHDSRRRPRGLRNDSTGRYSRRVSDRIARPDEHASTAEADEILRSGHRGGDRAPWPDPGEDGPPLLAAALWIRAGEIPERGGARGPGEDPRRAAIPGAGHEARGGGGGIFPRRSRPTSARHGRLAENRSHQPI